MLRSDKMLIVIITSLICASLFTLSFINIAYCEDSYLSSWNAFYSQWETNDLNADLRLTTSTNDILAVLSPVVPNGARGGYVVSDVAFTSTFRVYIDNEQQGTGFDNRESSIRSFNYHGIRYTYHYCELFSYYYSEPNQLKAISGESAVLNFDTQVDLDASWTYSDYIYLLYKGIINNPDLETPAGYYIPDNVIIESASDTLSSQYTSNKAISCNVAIPDSTHASYLNLKDVKVQYNNILAYLTYGFSITGPFSRKYYNVDVNISPELAFVNKNLLTSSANHKYEKYIYTLPDFTLPYLRGKLQTAVSNYEEVPDNCESVAMPYKASDGSKNIAYGQYQRDQYILNDYEYPNIPTSYSITYYLTLSDENYNKESEVFSVTAFFDENGNLSKVEYSGGVQPDGTVIDKQEYNDAQNHNNLISKNDSEQGNQDNSDLSQDALDDGEQLIYNNDDWNTINLDNQGFKGSVNSLYELLSGILPFLRNIMFFVPSWVFALMAIVMSTIIIMRVLGR